MPGRGYRPDVSLFRVGRKARPFYPRNGRRFVIVRAVAAYSDGADDFVRSISDQHAAGDWNQLTVRRGNSAGDEVGALERAFLYRTR